MSLSLPAWECGLKSQYVTLHDSSFRVTPCVGVWIEISIGYYGYTNFASHSLRGSVD